MKILKIISRKQLNRLQNASSFKEIGCCYNGIQSVASARRNVSSSLTPKQSHKFVVVGGGAGGLSVASFLARKFPNQVAVVEPSDVSPGCISLWFLTERSSKESSFGVTKISQVSFYCFLA